MFYLIESLHKIIISFQNIWETSPVKLSSPGDLFMENF